MDAKLNSENKKAMAAMLIDAAAECSNPDQMDAIEKLVAGDEAFAERFINCINKRQCAR